MNWTDEQKPLVESYAKGFAWISMYKDEEGKIEDFNKVNERMMALEDEMKAKGVTSEQIDKIMAGVTKILAKTTGEMSPKELEFVCQVIFGKGAKLTQTYMKDTDMMLINGKTTNYGYYRRHPEEFAEKTQDDAVDKKPE